MTSEEIERVCQFTGAILIQSENKTYVRFHLTAQYTATAEMLEGFTAEQFVAHLFAHIDGKMAEARRDLSSVIGH